MKPAPLLLSPILKRRVWGGRKLEKLGKQLPPGVNIGESWELADMASTTAESGAGSGGEARSVIARGPMRGITLSEAVTAMGVNLMGSLRLSDAGGFPLLVKYLDARENLSVQVHPSPAYAASHPGGGGRLKTESWYVLDAESGALIYKGLRPGLTPDALARSIRSGRIVDDLIAHPAHPGDFHHLPSGTLHALGAGVLVAEVQTPSDTTFRVHDWGRTGRELHIEQALECVDCSSPSAPALNSAGARATRLVETLFYSITERNVPAQESFEIENAPDRCDGAGAMEGGPNVGGPMVWMVTRGVIRVAGDRAEFPEQMFNAGDTILFPAAMNTARCTVDRHTTILEVRFPAQSSS